MGIHRLTLLILPFLAFATLSLHAQATDYVEQLALMYTNNMPAFQPLATNVSAVAQVSSDGYGPGYMLNGWTNKGYWYQAELLYSWPYDNNGFKFGYAVFDTIFNQILPNGGGTEIESFSGPVNNGDTVHLTLSFSNGNILFSALDLDTGAYASANYTAENATYFQGWAPNPGNHYTGLLTEEWFTMPFFGNQQPVYFSISPKISSAYIWADEYDSKTNDTLFDTGPVLLTDLTKQFQGESEDNSSERVNATEFVTGGKSSPTTTTSISTTSLSTPSSTTTVPNTPTNSSTKANLWNSIAAFFNGLFKWL